MKDVDFPLLLEPDYGKSVVARPGEEFIFPLAREVKETRLDKYKYGGDTNQLVKLHLSNLTVKEQKEFVDRYKSMPDSERRFILHSLSLRYPNTTQEDYIAMSDKEFQSGGQVDFHTLWQMDTGMVPIGRQIDVLSTDDQILQSKPAASTAPRPSVKEGVRASADVVQQQARQKVVEDNTELQRQIALRAQQANVIPGTEYLSRRARPAGSLAAQGTLGIERSPNTEIDNTYVARQLPETGVRPPNGSRGSLPLDIPVAQRENLPSRRQAETGDRLSEEYSFDHLRNNAGYLPDYVKNRLYPGSWNGTYQEYQDPVTNTNLLRSTLTDRYIVTDRPTRPVATAETRTGNFSLTSIQDSPGYIPSEISNRLVKVRDTVDRRFEELRDPVSGYILVRNKLTGKYIIKNN